MKEPKEKIKKIELKNRILVHFPNKKLLDDLPIVYPVAKISGCEFFSNSEKNRFEKTLQSFSNLKFLLDNDSKNKEKHIIKVIK